MMHIVADNAIVESDKRSKSYMLGIQDLLQLEIIKLGDVEHD
jgi:hypothetical protein